MSLGGVVGREKGEISSARALLGCNVKPSAIIHLEIFDNSDSAKLFISKKDEL